jgi:hypothetical protein
MKIPVYCYITSWIILIQGIIAYTYIPNELTISHVVVGITSVVNHNRRDKWYYKDIYSFVDWIAVLNYIYQFYSIFGLNISIFIIIYSLINQIFIGILNIYGKLNLITILHCAFHLYFIITIPKFYSLLLR